MLMTVLMLVSVAWIPLIHLSEKDDVLEEAVEKQPTITTTQNFATNNGFNHTNLTQDSVTGRAVLERPPNLMDHTIWIRIDVVANRCVLRLLAVDQRGLFDWRKGGCGPANWRRSEYDLGRSL